MLREMMSAALHFFHMVACAKILQWISMHNCCNVSAGMQLYAAAASEPCPWQAVHPFQQCSPCAESLRAWDVSHA